MSLAPYVRAMGRGPGRGRNLTREEAQTAFTEILAGRAAPEAVGALLMLMRYRGETPDEVAGIVTAMRATSSVWSTLRADIDWPSYAAGRTRGLPLFLLSAKLLAQAGQRIVLHGWNSNQNPIADVRAALPILGIAMADTPEAAARTLDQDSIVYLPLERLSQKLLDLVQLRDVLGLRSPINTALRAFNPTGAALSLQGVFHPPYAPLQQNAAQLLGQPNLIVLKGAGGEFERNPTKAVKLHKLEHGAAHEGTAMPLLDETRRMNGGEDSQSQLKLLWDGDRTDPFATAVIVGTAALALGQSKPQAVAEAMAQNLWANRHHVSQCA